MGDPKLQIMAMEMMRNIINLMGIMMKRINRLWWMMIMIIIIMMMRMRLRLNLVSGQKVFIGINTFWGLMMLSVFFGMMSCTVVCAVLNFQRMFCRDGFFKLNGSESYEWKRMQKDYQSDGLDTIDEDDNVKHPEKDPGAGGWVSNSAEDEQLVK